jgi:type VI secretion system protein
MRGSKAIVVLITAGLVLAACATKVSTERVDVRVDAAANDNSPVPVELVLVKEEEMLEALLALSAREWFEQRAQLRADFPKAFQSAYWEFVPGQRMEISRLPFGRKGHALIVYANYSAPGEHRLRIDTRERVTLLLGEAGFSVEPAR